MEHKLPISGYTIEINDCPLSGQIEDLDDFFANNTKSTVDETGKSIGEFTKPVGVMQREYATLKKITYIKSIKDADGVDVPVSGDTLRKLPFKDGEVVKGLVMEAEENLKKK